MRRNNVRKSVTRKHRSKRKTMRRRTKLRRRVNMSGGEGFTTHTPSGRDKKKEQESINKDGLPQGTRVRFDEDHEFGKDGWSPKSGTYMSIVKRRARVNKHKIQPDDGGEVVTVKMAHFIEEAAAEAAAEAEAPAAAEATAEAEAAAEARKAAAEAAEAEAVRRPSHYLEADKALARATTALADKSLTDEETKKTMEEGKALYEEEVRKINETMKEDSHQRVVEFQTLDTEFLMKYTDALTHYTEERDSVQELTKDLTKYMYEKDYNSHHCNKHMSEHDCIVMLTDDVNNMVTKLIEARANMEGRKQAWELIKTHNNTLIPGHAVSELSADERLAQKAQAALPYWVQTRAFDHR
jgi:hypothetical protein